MKTLLNLSALFLFALGACAYATPPAVPPTKPAATKTTLSAEIVATKDTYGLDAAGAGKAFRDKLDAIKLNGPAPKTPDVNLILRLTNNTDAPMHLTFGGDNSTILFTLIGPGAVTITPRVAMTREFRKGTPATIPPGKSHDIAITSLSAGARGISQHSYWTELGDYTLAAEFAGTTEGETPIKITTAPVKLKIVAEEKQ